MTRDWRTAGGTSKLRALEAVLRELTIGGEPVGVNELVAHLRARGGTELVGHAKGRMFGALRRLIAEGQSLGRIILIRHTEGKPLYGLAAKRATEQEAAEVGLPQVAEPQQLVLDALAAAETMHFGPVTVREICAFIPDSAALAARGHKSTLSIGVSNTLSGLAQRGLVSPLGLANERRYSRTVAGGARRGNVAEERSQRQTVLALAIAASRALKRPVRLADVLAQGWPEGSPESASRTVSHALLSLGGTGDLIVVDHVRGAGTKGTTLYVPRGSETAGPVVREPLSELEVVQRAFQQLWKDELERATGEERRPRPFSTGQVRRYLGAMEPTKGLVVEPTAVGMLMGRLSIALGGGIRVAKTSESSHMLLWAPADVTDDELDLEATYATESEKVVEAARRAAASSGSLTVTQEEVRRETLDDERLALTGRDAAHSLYYLSKATVAWGKHIRRARVRQLVVGVGRVAQVSHYVVRARGDEDDAWNAKIAAGRAEVARMQIGRALDDARLEEELSACDLRQASLIVVGRLRTVAAKVQRLARELDEIEDSAGVTLDARDLAGRLERICRSAEERELLAARDGLAAELPTEVRIEETGWTGAELIAEWCCFDRSKERMGASDVVRQLSLKIRRIRNPDFVAPRFGGRIGAAFLFERVSARIYLARRYGGRECGMLAAIVDQTLGGLRDCRYMMAEACGNSAEARLRGIAALAFYGGDQATQMLVARWECEPDAHIRAAILWGCAFNHYAAWRDLASFAAASENVRLRSIGRALLLEGAMAWTT